MKKLFVFLVSLPLMSFGSIYGEDNTVDALDFDNISSVLSANQSVGAIIIKDNMTVIDSERLGTIYKFQRKKEYTRFCSNISYAHENKVVQCGSVLIAPNKVLTASFCARSCENVVVAFGFNSKNANDVFTEESVFKCKKSTSVTIENRSFRVIELDRDTNLTPMTFSSQYVQPTDILAKYGFSFGSPLKLATDATIRTISETAIVSNLDMFGGDAGGPLLNQDTGEVVGINVSGDQDIYTNPVRYCSEPLYFEEGEGIGTTSIPVLKQDIDMILQM